MSSHVIDMITLRHMFGTEEMRKVWSEENRLQKHLDVEKAVALAEGELGLIPQEAAQVIASKADARLFDRHELAQEAAKSKHTFMATVNMLQKLCGPKHGEYVHYGLTTQDVVDTGMILQLKEAHQLILAGVKKVARHLARLADQHKTTPMVARTHGMQGLPTTFGFKLAVLLDEMVRHYERLKEAEKRTFTGVLGGAVGTYASFGPLGSEVERLALKKLGLMAPNISWHSSRDRVAEYIGILGMISATLGKMANEFYNLMRSEINEVEEPFTHGKVGSSTMPHKRNPAALEGLASLTKPIRYNVALVQEAMIVEHERDAMSWRGEWIAVPETCIYLSAQLAVAENVLEGLVVKPENMKRNLYLSNGLLLSERVMFALADKIGKQTAHHLVYENCMKAYQEGRPLLDVLQEDEQIRSLITREELQKLLDPETYLGEAPQVVERVLENARQTGILDD